MTEYRVRATCEIPSRGVVHLDWPMNLDGPRDPDALARQMREHLEQRKADGVLPAGWSHTAADWDACRLVRVSVYDGARASGDPVAELPLG